MKTILLSTSSLWNCGDDFIREGVLELLQLKEDVRTLWWNRGFGISKTYANSLKVNLPLMNYFIVAGTPKWIFNSEPIYRYCLKKGTPLSIIGVGTRDIYGKSQYNLLKKVAKSGLCEAALARDKSAAETLQELGFKDVELILDPCFFKKPIHQDIRELNILGWREQYSLDADPKLLIRFPGYALRALLEKKIFKRENLVKKRKLYNEFMLNVFNKLPNPKLVTVHDNREIKKAEELFGKEYVFYSTDPNKLFAKYSKAKFYIGSRIHGALPALLHGASIHLIYTTKKSQVLSDAIRILSPNVKDIQTRIKIDIFNTNQRPETIEPPEQPSNNTLLNSALTKERERVHNILKSKPILKKYIL